MKKESKIVMCLLLCIIMLSGCRYSSRYTLIDAFSVEEKGGYHYTQGLENDWSPISGTPELIGFAGKGYTMPVYGFDGDTQKAVIHVGKLDASEVQPGYFHRTDLIFPEISLNTITSILYVSENRWEKLLASDAEVDLADTASTASVSDAFLISAIADTLMNGQQVTLPLTTPNNELGHAFVMQWCGFILFLNSDLPGIGKSIYVYTDGEDYYLTLNVNADNIAECIPLPMDIMQKLKDTVQ